MTREKKKVRSVGGQKFVPVKKEKRDSAAKEDYKERKQQNLAKKKRVKSLEQKRLDAEKAASDKANKTQKRPTRLKQDPKKVAERSQAIIESSNTEAKE